MVIWLVFILKLVFVGVMSVLQVKLCDFGMVQEIFTCVGNSIQYAFFLLNINVSNFTVIYFSAVNVKNCVAFNKISDGDSLFCEC